MSLNIKVLSHLAKVFPDKIFGEEIKIIEGAQNQELAFQLALSGEGEYELAIISTLGELCAYRVGYVYSKMPIYAGIEDDNYLTYKSGLFPDALIPFEGKITLEKGKNESLWISLSGDKPAGAHSITVCLLKDGKIEAQASLEASIHPFDLPEKDIIFTQWFHSDCIATAHGVKPLSAKHWALMENYLRLASEHGMNMVLTPVLTPPLDTEVGGERPTVQLVDIEIVEGEYRFDFKDLIRYAKMARECGIKYLEINHMFTQWGASCAPKVIAKVNGRKKRIFGWETSASDPEYVRFLNALIPQIIDTLTAIGFKKDELFFHISDEPSLEQIESYQRAHDILAPLTEGCGRIDALSNLEFFKKGLIDTPVVAIDAIEPFMAEGVADLWGYYCCAQSTKVSNRFFDMPSSRTRIIGTQIYKYALKGFLHWGYNFYYTQYSKRLELNPFEESDAGGAFPSGDSFSVYPYGDGAIPSIRQKVFAYALDDYRLLKLVESKIGVLNTHRLINASAEMEITMKQYPKTDAYYDRLYKACFEVLEELE